VRDVLVERNAARRRAGLGRARETPRMAFAPRFALFGVPSRSIMILSTARWSAASMPHTAGPRMSFTFAIALRQPLPRYRFLSPSRSSHAS